MAFKFLGQRQLGKLPSRWVSTILMVAIDPPEAPCQANRKEGAGHYAPLARPLEPVPPQGIEIRRRHLFSYALPKKGR